MKLVIVKEVPENTRPNAEDLEDAGVKTEIEYWRYWWGLYHEALQDAGWSIQEDTTLDHGVQHD
jgi:hypothetical protein